jgi:hypothetical protein
LQEINNLTLKNAAKKYIEMGFGVVPRTPNGRAFLIPKDTREPGNINEPLTTTEQVEAVWAETPDANISIVDEGLIIIDVDQHEGSNGVAQMKEMNLPKTLSQWTPNEGLHLFYTNPKKTKYRKIGNGLDIISGHYGLMVAPSVVDGRAYRWANDREMKQCPIELENNEKMKDGQGEIPGYILEGERNNQLTRIAGIYAGRGLEYDSVFEGVWGANLIRCSKPLDKSEVHQIVASIMNSEESKEEGLTAKIRNFIEEAPGFFTLYELDRELNISADERKSRSVILNRFAEQGKIERGNQRGVWRICNSKAKKMNFFKRDKTSIALPLPLDLGSYVKVKPRNIIIVAGSPNAGKTAFALNVVHGILNSHASKLSDLTGIDTSRNSVLSNNYLISATKGPDSKPLSVLINEQINKTSKPISVNFFNSEMGSDEMIERLDEFPGGVESFTEHDNFNAYERAMDFQDVLDPNGINVIDYLQIHDKFWMIADKISKIHQALKTGVAVICIQKKSESSFARGGEFGIELARLALALDNNSPYGHVCTVVKNKIPMDTRNNLNGLSRDYKLGGGACIKSVSEWRYIKDKKERARINSLYEAEGIETDEFEVDENMAEMI